MGVVRVRVVATAAVAWFVFPGNALVMFTGLIGGLVLGLVNAFKREPSPGLIVGYAPSFRFPPPTQNLTGLTVFTPRSPARISPPANST